MRIQRGFLAIVLFAMTACSSAANSDDGAVELRGPSAPPANGVFADTVGDFCGGRGDSIIEMAFRGTVVVIDDSAARPWTTFRVTEWFTDDIGIEVGLWSPDFNVDVGDELLVASSRYSVGDRASGDVYWCESAQFTEAEYEIWLQEYGGSVVAGAATPEREPDRATLDEIDAFNALWIEAEPASYTYTVSVSRGHTSQDECAGALIRVVVEDSVTTQAEAVNGRCEVALADAPAIATLFDLARDVAGAREFDLAFDEEFGFVRDISAFDRSVAAWGGVREFSVGASPISDEFDAGLAAARIRWSEAGISSYNWTLDALCFCGFESPFEMKVHNGEFVGQDVDPNWVPVLIVEDLFDQIERNRNADRITVAFHPELGYPTEVRIDSDLNGSDDEIDYFVREFTPVE